MTSWQEDNHELELKDREVMKLAGPVSFCPSSRTSGDLEFKGN